MSDIVERLLTRCCYGDARFWAAHDPLSNEAVNEITRLRTQVAEQEATIRRLSDLNEHDATLAKMIAHHNATAIRNRTEGGER